MWVLASDLRLSNLVAGAFIHLISPRRMFLKKGRGISMFTVLVSSKRKIKIFQCKSLGKQAGIGHRTKANFITKSQ